MVTYRDVFQTEEEVPANAVSDGGVEGIGYGPKGEPGFPTDLQKRRRKDTVLRGILTSRGMKDGV